MHVLPRVRELHERFPDVLTVIGVHAGKFSTERRTDRIAEACDRLGVAHPVVNDRQFRIWHDYAVNAWPTVVLIDPEGYLSLIASGEFDLELMAAAVERVVGRARERGTLVAAADPFPARMPHHDGALRFPTRAVIAGGRLWIADTGHGRVLECDWDAEECTAVVVGSHEGLGEPRGLAEVAGHVFVADRAGQAVWRLEGEDRIRVAGTGRVADRAIATGAADRIDLRSPWGLAARRDALVIAMAGSHQLWLLELASGELSPFAGTGGEALYDDTPRRAALAQPTGLAHLDGDALAFVDCESSAVRTVDSHSVDTLVGTGLFDFGDRSGVGEQVLLQHCEDVARVKRTLVVADTYNDRLKSVDPATRECSPWPGEAGETGGLREPGGVWSDGSTILVSDTGHHRILHVERDGALREVELT